MAPDDNRIDLDSEESGNLRDRLAAEVSEAARAVRERKARDVARERARKKDATLMYLLIIVGAVAVIALAVWMNFGRGTSTQGAVNYRPRPVQQRTTQPQVVPTAPINRPPQNPFQPQVGTQAQGTEPVQDRERDTANPDEM